MTRFDNDRSVIPARLALLRGDLATSFERRRIFRRTVAELSRLSDRDLADLGCDRLGIVQMARDAARRAVPRH
ncbi:uncharacterized protein YjiS (DUF1127 family) [Limimaricola variabilis]|uniref:Uncharacterized protein YjiS (DUF1127 family) n=1 Tax=Limimaricola variabilis TaxID=1492771 RepID=A0ABR6HNB2_9RHOB|nr:DUF1127 domain-containing protein [Limimaricola variabilis]MBB3711938.1 uncharacterized protein YjiS (DUF1127 family) [Limimaricola variabilis]WPY96718.1 DUF1127 domain-containing protein [Limimaricola variabilis]